MTRPPYLEPFVLSVPPAPRERRGEVDFYLPEAAEPRPAVVFVHGGPVPAELTPTPRDWPIYLGYGSAVAARGVVGVTVDHGLHDVDAYPRAADNVAVAVDLARRDPRVDSSRVAVWFFSGGGMLISDWLRDPPAWLRCLAATYPVLAPWPGTDVDGRFRAADAVAKAGRIPIVLTKVGREREEFAATVEGFLTAARDCGANLKVIDVPDGQHGFDQLDHTDQSRAAVEQALDSVLSHLL